MSDGMTEAGRPCSEDELRDGRERLVSDLIRIKNRLNGEIEDRKREVHAIDGAISDIIARTWRESR